MTAVEHRHRVERLHTMVDQLPPGCLPEAEERLRALLEDDADDWNAFLDRRRRALPPGVTPEEIEADITTEMDAMRQERIAREEEHARGAH